MIMEGRIGRCYRGIRNTFCNSYLDSLMKEREDGINSVNRQLPSLSL